MRLSDLPIIPFIFFALGALVLVICQPEIEGRRPREMVDICSSRRRICTASKTLKFGSRGKEPNAPLIPDRDPHPHIFARSCGGYVRTQKDERPRARTQVDLSTVIWLSCIFRRSVSRMDLATDRKHQ